MSDLEALAYSALTIPGVIGFVWAGIFIGRECGTFENFVLQLIRKISE